MPSLFQRFAIGFVGQGLGRLVVVLSAVLLVPALIAHWGVDGYGQWMTVSALVSCLGYANLGLVSTASNDIVMAAASQDESRARHSFQVSCNLAFGPLPLFLAVLVAAASFLPLLAWFNLNDFSRLDLVLILSFGALQLCFETLRGIMAAVLYSRGRYGLSYNISAGTKFVELATLIFVVAALGGRPIHVAALTATFAFLDLVVAAIMARHFAAWARFDPRVMDVAWLRRHLKPSMGFIGYNLATQGVLLQGPRLVLGWLLGGSAVAVYAIYATAMRLVDQLFLAFMSPAGVEISHAAGRGEPDQLVRLIAIVAQFSILALLGVSVFLLAFGPVIFKWWTHDRIAFHYLLMVLYLAMSATNLPGRLAAQVLISLNALRGVAIGGLAIALASIALGVLLVPLLGLPSVLIAGILGEIATSFLMVAHLNRRLGLPFDHLVRRICNFADPAALVWAQARSLLKG